MNTKFKSITVAVCLAGLLFAASCKGKTENKNEAATDQTENVEELGKEYTSAYVCPMHCEGSGSEEKGNCPKCGMAYVANEEHVKDGHTHE
ncbi:heavy metal-binding domain-containing protein [Lentiprolixibacter aurantiacus]|uniref:Heavy metal binding domain-containing protein n=1 Tax=Lentiprolixibacter aurantiacus TaxID=2993939 RepID=A0AAE3MMB3_9FLAO|nr:heavy metal-binding domain-containing protein [Lentiprolixibacter aurantiacus]MCX2720341.1 hypothetical protein [Lentiprolixibacter aurantiacus]